MGRAGWSPRGKQLLWVQNPSDQPRLRWAMSPGTGNASHVLWVQGRNRAGRSQLRERVEQVSSRLLLQ